jgi:hypothetical protein
MKTGDLYRDKNDNAYRIANVDPAAALKCIKDSRYGDHNLIVYPCMGQFEEFYIECCKDSVLEKNEIFVVVTHYQHISAVRKKMHLAGIDTERHEKQGKLAIIDSQIAYQTTLQQESTFNISNLISALVRGDRTIDGKGISLLSDPGTFILNNRIADLVSYEVSLPGILSLKIKAFCCYHREDFRVLQEEQKKIIIGHHSINLFIS